MSNKEIIIEDKEEFRFVEELKKRDDADAKRMLRFSRMPDLSRTQRSPIYELAQKIIKLPDFENFDVVRVPEIVPAMQSFDLFDFPLDHPARSKSDTYYVNNEYILRTHTTISWYYYLTSEYAKAKILKDEPLGVLTYGKVYRKDEIDRRHMNIFHQMDGYFLLPKRDGIIKADNLKDILVKIVQTVFGPDVKYRFNPDNFPYTDPSFEMEVMVGGNWIEVLGSGIAKPSVLEKLGVDSKNYTAWAFGFGLERLAIIGMELPDIRLLWSEDERVKKQLKLGHKYEEVSKYPPITRDISFLVDSGFVPNTYFDLIRDIGGDLVEEVALLDKYENKEKFGDKISYTYRVIYRSIERTLTTEEIEPIQQKITEETKAQFGAEIR